MLILTAGAAGFIIDTVLVSIGVFSPVPYLFPLPYSPLWMVLLWMNFAATLNFSLKGLQGRYLLSAVLGSIGGPAAYYSGAKLGAMTTIPEKGDLLVLSAAWAMAVPALFWLAGLINQKNIQKSF